MRGLKFVHITKTAGTSIENAGFREGLSWGRHHKEYGWWHGCFPLKSASLKASHDWFTVVRDPYERLLSEFHCVFAINEEPNDIVREWHLKTIKSRDAGSFNRILMRRILMRNFSGGHYTEQFRYLDRSTPIRIVRFERLPDEFDLLMKKYDLHVRLDFKSNKGRRVFCLDDIGEKALRLINQVYEKDFHTFGYEMRRTKPIL